MNTPNPTQINSPRHLPRVASLLVCLLSIPVVGAQQVAPATPTDAKPPATVVKLTSDTPPAAADLVELSPFVVNTNADVGYQASSSLAGIGLNTKLSDIGSSVAVITSQFLQDTASMNLRDMLIYQTSAEATGFGGNLSGSDAAPGGVPGEPSLGNGNGGTRLRGLAAADTARNYFKTVIPMDGYNTDRVEINRGANALLFGTGSPAGIINTSTTQANLNKQSGKAEFVFGSFGSWRGSFNANIVPAKGQFAIDVAALKDEQKFQQKYAYSDSVRKYIAVAFDPKVLRNRGAFTSTTLRASFELGDIESNRPRVLTPGDRYSSWFDATLPTNLKSLGATAKVTYDPTGVNNGSFSSFNSISSALRNATIGVIDNVNRAPVYFFQDTNTNVPRDNAPNNALAAGKAIFGRTMVLDNYFFPAETRVINGVSTAIPARTGIGVGMYSRELSRVRSDFGMPDGAFYTSDQMSDRSTFDFFNNTLIGPNSEGLSNLKSFDATLQQLMFKRKLGFELAYNRQHWDESLQSLLPSAAPYISIDVNTRMWTGEVNPNFGRAFVSTPGSASFQSNLLETRRAKIFYELNFAEQFKGNFGWILGKHVVAGLAQRQISNTDSRGGGSVFYTPDFWAPGSGQSRGSNTGKRVSTWVYLGAPGTSFFNASSLAGAQFQGLQQSLFNLPQTVDGNGVLLSRLRAATAAQATLPDYQPFATNVNLQRENREVTNTAGFATLSRSTLDSQAGTLQSNWLGDHLVSTVGWRKEKNVAVQALAPFEGTGEGYVLVNDPRYKIDYRSPSLPALVPQIYEDSLFSWSGVAKAPQKFLKRLPGISALNAYYGYSENFQPPTSKVVSAFGDEIPPPAGNTKEVGVYLEALEGLISVRVNYFKTTQQHVINGAVAGIPAAIMQINQRAFAMISSSALPHPAGTTPADSAYYYPTGYILPPKALLDAFNYSIAPTASGTFILNQTDPGIKDTSDYQTKGTEVEVMLKPARGLSFSFNVAKVEAIQSNTGAFARKLLFGTPTSTGDPLAVEWLKPWASRVAIALGSVGNEGTSDQFILNNNFISTVLNPFNTATLSDGSPSTELRKWRANLVGRYAVQSGKLKGFEYGGGVRWQDRAAIGFPVVSYHVSLDPKGNSSLTPVGSTPAQASDVRGYDVKHPFYGPDEIRYDLWVGYSTKIMRDRVGLRVQFNVRNAGVQDKLVPIRINPDGKAAAWSITESQRLTLTTKFSF
jgi:outer membrane receptor protein involved in Fe transport